MKHYLEEWDFENASVLAYEMVEIYLKASDRIDTLPMPLDDTYSLEKKEEALKVIELYSNKITNEEKTELSALANSL